MAASGGGLQQRDGKPQGRINSLDIILLFLQCVCACVCVWVAKNKKDFLRKSNIKFK